MAAPPPGRGAGAVLSPLEERAGTEGWYFKDCDFMEEMEVKATTLCLGPPAETEDHNRGGGVGTKREGKRG